MKLEINVNLYKLARLALLVLLLVAAMNLLGEYLRDGRTCPACPTCNAEILIPKPNTFGGQGG